MKKTILRWSVYLLGLFSLAFGIVLSTKVNLGISPISSVAYSISVIWKFDFDIANNLVYVVFIAAQFALRGKSSRVVDLLQLAVSLVFNVFVKLLSTWLTYTPDKLYSWVNIGLLLASVVFIGIGVSASVNMKLIPNPGDGIVHAIAEKTGLEHGLTKNIFDISCVCVTAALGLIFAGEFIGLHFGTVVAMLGVGRVVALVNRLLKQKVYIPLTTKE
ncbi:MAG: hypothetical protein E7450_03350 [Ruminococcaceae bacterium]|nr:hypothetical protein [Oscillospiraceae bacterium]